MWTGFFAVEVAPSPNSQSQAVGPPVVSSVKTAVYGAYPIREPTVKPAWSEPRTVTRSGLVTDRVFPSA